MHLVLLFHGVVVLMELHAEHFLLTTVFCASINLNDDLQDLIVQMEFTILLGR